MTELDLRDTILAGHSMGTGEVTRYLSRYGVDRVSRGILLAPLAPFLRKTADNPDGVDGSVFDGFRQAIAADRFAYLTAFCTSFFNYDQTKGQQVSEEAFRAHQAIGAQASARAMYQCIDAITTDFRADVPRLDLPILIVQGDQDAVLPYPLTGQRLAPMLPDGTLVTLKGAPHGIPWTHADEVTKAIMDFIGTPAMARA